MLSQRVLMSLGMSYRLPQPTLEVRLLDSPRSRSATRDCMHLIFLHAILYSMAGLIVRFAVLIIDG